MGYKAQRAVLGILAVLFAGSMFIASKIGGRYIPTVDEGRYAVVAKLPSGADVNKADRIGKVLEDKAVTLHLWEIIQFQEIVQILFLI